MSHCNLLSKNQDYAGPAKAEALFHDLRARKSSAILFLKQRTYILLARKCYDKPVVTEDLEEMVNDAVLLCLQKIQQGAFVFQDCSPLAYSVGIGQKLLANYFRRSKVVFLNPEEVVLKTDSDPLQYYLKQEQERQLEEYLFRLGAKGAEVIRLFYFEGYRDEEVVQRQLTPYKTTETLKNKRCQYLKKLRAMVKGE